MSTQTIELTQNRIDLEVIKKTKINLAIFGHGNVGSELIDQIFSAKKEISKRRDIDLNIFAIANSNTVLLEKNIEKNWSSQKLEKGKSYVLQDIVSFASQNNFENLIAIDNTADYNFVKTYPMLIEHGFHLVSSNKIGNTMGLSFYRKLRESLLKNKKEYLYETNVGAGLPLIDTIKLLHLSGENITRIKGVFSGSLSYIFNNFSEDEKLFSEVLHSAIRKGFTEPDPREDLCGNDVGRKLLILARELDLHCELRQVSIQNLVPKSLRTVTKEVFLSRIKELDVPFHIVRKNQEKGHVLRYLADLHGDLSKDDGGILDVKLVSLPKNSMIGQLEGSDSIFEIYTESYGNRPIIIQGAGAGAEVTARGVFGDVLRISEKII